MIRKTSIFLVLCLSIHIINACQLVNITPGTITNVNVTDTDEGVIYSHPVLNVIGITLNSGDVSRNYFDAYISDSTLYLTTTDVFKQYEEHETAQVFLIQGLLQCPSGVTANQFFEIRIIDTNNNSPVFQPTNENNEHEGYEFNIVPPLGVGYEITNCHNFITVRDIDLTTQRIDFQLTGSDDFEIIYDEASSTEPKLFLAILRTTTIIRSLAEPLELIISATDVDETEGPPLTTYTTVRIIAEDGAQLPDEPVFGQPLYNATYTRDHEIILEGSISLKQGYDVHVNFTLDQEYYDHFTLNTNENDVRIEVKSPLSEDIMTRQQIFLIVRAERELTSGATTTVVVQLPEEITLEFERTLYEGAIVDNVLEISELVLSQGYEGYTVSATTSNDFFTASVSGNRITLMMDESLPESTIEDINSLNFEVIASTERSSASTVITLQIVKNDTVTPVFAQALYEGTYDSELRLDIELIQGYDDTVEIDLRGEYAPLFVLIRNEHISTLTVENLSSEIIGEQSLTLTIEATKPRTVGAISAITIALPKEITLEFERTLYEGAIVDNVLEISELVLSQGYEGHTISVTTSNDFFTTSVSGNRITLMMDESLPESIIEDYNFLNFEVVASTERSSASTVITLQIVKNDTVTPVFAQALYEGTYDSDLRLDIELIQGYDDTVEIDLRGEYAPLFVLIRNEHISTLTVENLSSEIIGEQSLTLTIEATKPRTVGATSAITIALPKEITLEFERTLYEGAIVDNVLEISELVLSQGYEGHTISVTTSNDFFTASVSGNRITLMMDESLPESTIEDNNFLNFEVVASTERSSASTVINLQIVKNDTVTPVFAHVLYEETYDSGLRLDIELIQGYDDTVEIDLRGEHAHLFILTRNEHISTLTVDSLPPDVIAMQNLMLTIEATKPRTVGASAVIAIALPRARELEFDSPSYSGTYQNGLLSIDAIELNVDDDEIINFTITGGDYATYFEASNSGSRVTISLLNQLPDNVITQNNFLRLTISASDMNAYATAVIFIEIIKEDTTTPIFNQTIYHGTYSDGRMELSDIILMQGFDDTVSFKLDEAFEHSSFFGYTVIPGGISITLDSVIPDDIIFSEKALIFSVLAEKPLTVGAHTTISITFPSELTDLAVMKFSRNTYVGSLENEVLNLEDIVLDVGYVTGTDFFLTGDYAHHFTPTITDNVVKISTYNTLPSEIIRDNKFIILELEARRERAVSVFSSIIIDLVQEENTGQSPVFHKAYYRGSYEREGGLQIEEIFLTQGYDETVEFDLSGEFSEHFNITDINNVITLNANVPEDVWENNDLLVFTIIANKPDVTNGQAAIVIDFLKESQNIEVLGFEKTNYLGVIENGMANLEPITLTDGYRPEVNFTLLGDLEPFFGLTIQDATVTLQLQNAIPEELIPTNRIIILEIRATSGDSIPAVATIVLEIILEDSSPPTQLVFAETYYVGTYTIEESIVILENPISLSEGYDENVTFELEGDESSYFEVVQSGNSITLRTPTPIPNAVVANNNQLLFIINAQRSNAATARATVIIHLPNEFSENAVLGFEKTSYLGVIENGTVNIEQIVLSEGYTSDVSFSLHGDLAPFFDVSWQDENVALHLLNAIPEELIPTNRIIILDIRATAADSMPAIATIILEVISDNFLPPTQLNFAETYYVGTYTVEGSIVILENPISLSEGYDENVTFELEGDESSYFEVVQSGNSITLRTPTPIPNAVVANNNQLLFIINAQRSNAATARATVIIHLPNEFSEDAVLGFEKTSYLGVIENGTVNIEQIVLSEGYTSDVSFSLHGDLASFFDVSWQDENVALHLLNAIPEELIPTNRIIILDIRATAADSMPAIATIILEVISDNFLPPTQLNFAETYYVGTYTVEGSMVILENPISLSEGYDENVTFELEGDESSYFEVVQSGNSITLRTPTPIPNAVVANNNQLLFIINAQRSNAAIARATVIIHLPNEFSENAVLGFEKTSYLGVIENGTVNIEQIVLSEGYTSDVSFSLHGDLAPFFDVSWQDENVALHLLNAIPEELIPTNRIIILDIRATAADSMPAIATIILEVISDNFLPPTQLNFAETYYVGTYTVEGSIVILENPISLSEGYDENVTFELEGDESSYFEVVQSGNSITLRTPTPIPNAVVANNNQLLFIINAQRSNAATARATVIIHLPNEFSEDAVLGFEKTSYLGVVENGIVNIEQIVLSEGYTSDVSFSLHGDLAPFFGVSWQDENVDMHLLNAIPEELIPTNRIIILDIRATAADSMPAIATVILEVILDNSLPPTQLVFAETYYVGTYTVEGSIVILDNPISLSEGYDENVTFELEGDESSYFEVVQSGNTITLRTPTPIPNAVVANNNQLLFIINAQRSNAATARATVIIYLPNEFSEDVVLGFEKTSYLGVIENGIVNIEQIVLSEGYTSDVSFNIHGDLAPFFDVSWQDENVALHLLNAIPEELIPPNRIIILDIRATTADSMPAIATIILEAILDNSLPPTQLVFAETYYVGTYTVEESIVILDNHISLSEGYDENVTFELEGDESSYFEVVQSGNSITLRTPTPIPNAVVANNNQLLFIINAQRSNATTARATVIIHLPNEFSEDAVLGFEKTSYLGVVENGIVNIEQIVLSEGYTSDVSFSLHGDLAPFFDVSWQDENVDLHLLNAIPEELIPTNRIIILDIRATAADSMPAIATVILEVILDNSLPPTQLVFAETYYVGTYTVEGSIVILDNPISLSEGYDENVTFELEGDESSYFEVVQSGNTITLRTPTPIPNAVVANNNQLLFIINAQRSNATTARATVIIHLPNEFSEDVVLGFEKTSYLGVIENGIVNIEQIVLSEGYTSDVSFSIHGDLAPFFDVSWQDENVALHILNAIPEELIPPNRIIILDIRATTADSMPAIATIILEAILDNSLPPTQLVFAETYYVGTYTVEESIVILDNPISLSEGYDGNVTFELEGDESSYFEVVQSGNSITLRTPTPIPNAVVANNNQLLFIINAQRSNAVTARATVIIHLPNEFSEDAVLGFEKTNYLGVIENGIVNIEQIVLSEGYTSDVSFSLHGDLAPFFDVSWQDENVALHLLNAIPEELIPSNRIIILDIRATGADSMPAIATIILEAILDNALPPTQLVFAETYYVGTYTVEESIVILDNHISLSEGYDENVTFELEGDDSAYFEVVQSGNSITLRTPTPIPNAVVANNNQLLFIINAQRSNAATARATVIIHLPNEFSEDVVLGFEKSSYFGGIENGIVNIEQIVLSEGYTSDVSFSIHGDLAPFFDVSWQDQNVALQLLNAIPEELIPTNRIIILDIRATAADSMPAITTIILEAILDNSLPATQLVFAETFYVGTYTVEESIVILDNPISLYEGYDENVTFELEGDESSYFEVMQSGNSITLRTPTPIPNAVVANNNQLLFIINAQRSNAVTARATVIIHLPNEFSEDAVLGFEKTSYLGVIENGIVTIDQIVLSEGYTSDVSFSVHGDLAPFFDVSWQDENVALHLLNAIPEELIPTNRIIILDIRATAADSMPAIATVILEAILDDSLPLTQLVFAETYYVGTYTVEGSIVILENPISLSEGYDENVTFELEGDESSYFEVVQSGNSITLRTPTPIPNAVVANNNQLLFIINAQRSNATTARATVIIHLPNEFSEDAVLGFEKTSYLGVIENGIVNIDQIVLSEGYTSDVSFSVHGGLAPFFGVSWQDENVVLHLLNAIPEELIPTNRIIILDIRATAADLMPAIATIILEAILDNSLPPTLLVFAETYYVGTYTVDGSVVVLENPISLSEGYDENVTFELEGDDSTYFEVVQSGNSITLITPTPIPNDVVANNNQLLFIIRAQTTNSAIARATIIIHLPNDPQDPIVTFNPSAYMLHVEVFQTGIIGQVSATATNGETVSYSLALEDDHLQARLTINNDGELYLSSPANSGEYIFQVIATTLNSQARGTAAVYLTVESINVMLPPLIVLNRDEEEPHENLVVFGNTEYSDCTYSLADGWPDNQNWLYVDSNGLHSRTIDREDPSIAFMALSQVQIELVFYCHSTRVRRSLEGETRTEWLGPYDYGTKTWILADSISYNSTRSFVNLIVNDINDNAPIFIGKGNEPIVVGYPIPELEEMVLPRALVELQANDADIGENAALLYWSSEPSLAVSPSSGSVHVRDNMFLENDQNLIIHATDRNGVGLTGSINLKVKLLDASNIAVITVRNAFIEDEQNILANLSSVVGYDVKVLRSSVISIETEEEISDVNFRKTRESTTASGASLELYVYGLIETEPVAVEQLAEDINNNQIAGISIVSTVTLEDHLQGRVIRISRHSIGLLVATIVLSVLVFILIMAIAIWFFLKWRKGRNYDEFSDENSIESRNDSIIQDPKSTVQPTPRMNIEEIKRSERRLQEMINAPFNEATVVPTTSTKEKPVESLIDIAPPDSSAAIVIQDKLKDADSDMSDVDEFGEVRPTRRKSVVTFNEKVERIIHVEDNQDNASDVDIEVFKF